MAQIWELECKEHMVRVAFPKFTDFKLVPLMFLTLGLGSQVPFKGHIPWFKDPNPRVQTLRVQKKTP